MRRTLLALLVLAGLLAAPAAAQSPSFVKDSPNGSLVQKGFQAFQ